jgi:hypothetical protein
MPYIIPTTKPLTYADLCPITTGGVNPPPPLDLNNTVERRNYLSWLAWQEDRRVAASLEKSLKQWGRDLLDGRRRS